MMTKIRFYTDVLIVAVVVLVDVLLDREPDPYCPACGGTRCRQIKVRILDERGLEGLEYVAVAAVVVAAALIVWAAEVSPGLADSAHWLRMTLVGIASGTP